MALNDGYKGVTGIGLMDILSNESTIDAWLNTIKFNLLDKEDEIKRLKKANAELRSQAYENEEIQRLKNELERARKDLSRGFSISEKEQEEINEWMKDHKHSGNSSAIGGAFDYTFIPTSIGTIGSCRCSICGNSFIFKDL